MLISTSTTSSALMATTVTLINVFIFSHLNDTADSLVLNVTNPIRTDHVTSVTFVSTENPQVCVRRFVCVCASVRAHTIQSTRNVAKRPGIVWVRVHSILRNIRAKLSSQIRGITNTQARLQRREGHIRACC